MAEVIYITCPLCGMNRVLEKTGASAIARGVTIKGTKGRIRFDHIDLANAPIVQIRERATGKEPKKRMRRGGGSGFTFKAGISLADIKIDPDYEDLINQIKLTAGKILEILK